MKKYAFPVLLMLAGCGGVSEVVSTAPGNYLVASQGVAGNGSGAAQKARAIQKANEYCSKNGKAAEVTKSEQVEPFFGRPPSAQIEFRCI